jgi:hypothetical protein
MPSIKGNEQGFSDLTLSVVVLVIVMIGAIAAYVIEHQTKTSPQTTNPKSSPSSSVSGPMRDPGLTKEIAAAHQIVQSHKQVTVSAQVDWVDTGLKTMPGQHLWIDTNSGGKWSGNPQLFPYSDANGLTAYPGGYKIDAKANVLSLIGFVGVNPPEVTEQEISAGAPAGGAGGITNPGLFEPGNTLKNFTPTASGEVWLRNNDNTNILSDSGQQVAEVWITN